MNKILHLFCGLLSDVLSEAFQLLQGRNCTCRDGERLQAEYVAEVLILLYEGFKRLQSLTFLFQHHLKAGSYIFLLLEHRVSSLLLKTGKLSNNDFHWSPDTWDKQIKLYKNT